MSWRTVANRDGKWSSGPVELVFLSPFEVVENRTAQRPCNEEADERAVSLFFSVCVLVSVCVSVCVVVGLHACYGLWWLDGAGADFARLRKTNVNL